MKTQIIQLETHDDTISVKDKMDWSQTPRVLLVWPRVGKVLQNRLDLVLLERHCSANGSQLALLTRDRQVINQAEEVGIPVFQSRHSAQSQAWGKSFREFNRSDLIQKASQPKDLDLEREIDPITQAELPTWARIGLFSTAVLAVLAIGGLLLPSASISIPAVKTSHAILIPVEAVVGENEVSISGIIPARELAVMVEGQDQAPVTGSLAVAEEYAVGEAVFTNLGDQSILIPENTYLSTAVEGSPLFTTQIPGSTPEGIGAQVTIPIKALEPGSRGNIPANQLTRINQDLGADLTVTNPLPLSGGEDLIVPAPSQADRNRLLASLQAGLRKAAAEQISQALKDQDLPLDPYPVVDQVLINEYDPAEGLPGETLTLNLKIRYRIEYAAGSDLLSLARSAVNARYQTPDRAPILESISLTGLSDPKENPSDTWSWNMQVTWEDRRVFSDQEIIQLLLGKKPAEASQLLRESLGLSRDPEITLRPEWWWSIPALPFRIDIIQEGD